MNLCSDLVYCELEGRGWHHCGEVGLQEMVQSLGRDRLGSNGKLMTWWSLLY